MGRPRADGRPAQAERSLPWEPLDVWLTRWLTDRGESVSEVTMARALDVERETLRRWKTRGQVPLGAADRLAAKGLHLHISAIWPEHYWDLPGTKSHH